MYKIWQNILYCVLDWYSCGLEKITLQHQKTVYPIKLMVSVDLLPSQQYQAKTQYVTYCVLALDGISVFWRHFLVTWSTRQTERSVKRQPIAWLLRIFLLLAGLPPAPSYARKQTAVDWGSRSDRPRCRSWLSIPVMTHLQAGNQGQWVKTDGRRDGKTDPTDRITFPTNADGKN